LTLLPQQRQEQAQSFLLVGADIYTLLAAASNPPPRPEQRYFSKQRRLDRQGVEAGHVSGRVDASNMNMI
jgi:hypothetical protein